MMKTVHVLERSYEGTLPYGKEEIDGRLRRKHERSATAERYEPYPVRDGIRITADEMARAVNASVQRRSAASF